METEDVPEETTVSDRGMVTIPASLRRRLGIEAGDKLRWETDADGNLSETTGEKSRHDVADLAVLPHVEVVGRKCLDDPTVVAGALGDR